MKILFTRFPLESSMGGAEKQTLLLMDGLRNRGHAVAFAGSCPVLLSACKERGIPAVEWHIGPPPVTKFGVISFAWRKIAMKRKLTQLLEQFHSLDAICMLSLSEKLLLTDIAHAKGIRTFWIEHDRIGRWLRANPWLKLLLGQSENAITITVSDLSKKLYEQLGWKSDRLIAIPNGIEPPQDKRANEQTCLPAGMTSKRATVTIGCIARLSHEKGVDVLIEAMAGLPETVSLEIIGEGKEHTALQSLITKLHLNDRVKILRRIDDLEDVYNRIDALVLPSRDNDPFGLVAAEAMMRGIPTIVTDACGIAGYLEDGTDAIIAKAHSAPALEQAITRLLDPATYQTLHANTAQSAKKNFSAETMVQTYENVLTDSTLFSSR